MENFYINTNEHYRAKVVTETREARFNQWIQNKFPNKNIERSNPILQQIRAVKSSIEIDLIKRLVTLQKKGLDEFSILSSQVFGSMKLKQNLLTNF